MPERLAGHHMAGMVSAGWRFEDRESIMTAPSFHAAAAICLTILTFYGYAKGQLKIEIIALLTIAAIGLGLYVFPLPAARPEDGLKLAFEGFGHSALVTICALMVLGRGLVATGALEPAARGLAKVWRFNQPAGLLLTLALAFSMSMLVNDTPVLVLLLPILAQLAANGGMPTSRTLIPVNAAVLLGGMATTIGTSTNLLVVAIARDLGMAPIGIFHFTDIVLVAGLVALPYLWLIMPRLLPDNSPAGGHEPRRYDALLRLRPTSPMMGRTAAVLKAALPGNVRGDAADLIILDEDSVVPICGPLDALNEAAKRADGTLAPVWLVDRLRRDAADMDTDLVLVEMVIAPDSRLVGHTLQSAGIEDVAILGIHRAIPRIGLLQPGFALREGDILLVTGTDEGIDQFRQNEGLLQLEGGRDLPRSNKALLALAIMVGSVGLASMGVMPIAISALGGAILMFLSGCVRFDRVGRALSAKVIVLVASSIALGKFVLVSGAALWLSEVLASGLQFMPAAGVLAAVMLFVTVLTNFASNATAAAVGTPIAFNLAAALELPAEPLVLAVLFGCNLCYATPVAYQTNMMIMTEGDYRFADYVKTGLPLVVLMIVVLSTLLVLRYGL